MTTPAVTRILAPDGTSGVIPTSQLGAALKEKAQLGQRILAPDGTKGTVPLDRVQEAIKGGGQIIGEDTPKPQVNVQPQGLGSTLWQWAGTPQVSGRTLLNAGEDVVNDADTALFGGEPKPREDLYGNLQRAAAGVDPEHPYLQAAKTFAAGSVTDAAETAAQMGTSPVGMALAAAGPLGEGAEALNAVRAARALKLAQTAAGIGFGGQGAQQTYQAITDPNITGPEAWRQGLMGASMAAGGAAGAVDVLKQAPEAIRAAGRYAANAPEALAGSARQSGSEQVQRALGATTRENKAIAAKVGSEMAEDPARRILAWTRKGLQEKASAKADAVGQQIDDYYQSLPADATVPTQPILDHFEQSKNAFKGSQGEVLDQGAIDRIDALKQVVQQFGPDVPVDDIVKLRRLWDDQVAQAKGFYGKTLAEGSDIAAKREAASSIREVLADAHPDLAKLNKEYSFWANVRKVIGDTNLRKGSQAPPLGETVLAAGGLVKGGLPGMTAMIALKRAMSSTAWSTVSAATKFKIADFLADGNVSAAAKLLPPSGPPPGPGGLPPSILNQPPGGGAPPAGAAPTTPPVVPPFLRVGGTATQPGLNFSAPVPPVAGEAPAPEAAPPARPGTQMRMPWEIARTPAAQTPAPAENVAPAAPETPPAAPQAPTGPRIARTPEHLAQQEAAQDEAARRIQGGETDEPAYNKMREKAYIPELEDPQYRGISQEQDRKDQPGKSVRELKVNAKDQYTPEVQAQHDAEVARVLPDSLPSVVGRRPRVTIMSGGAASGKGSFLRRLLAGGSRGPVINSDNFMMGGEGAQGLPEAQMLKESDPMGAASRMHSESSDIAKQAQQEATDRKLDFVLDKVGSDPQKMATEIQNFIAEGYDVDLQGVDRNTKDAVNSMVLRARGTTADRGRWVPTHVLTAGHEGSAESFQVASNLLDKANATPDKGQHTWTLNSVPQGEARPTTFDKTADQNGVYNSVRWQEHQQKGGYSSDTWKRLGLLPFRQATTPIVGQPPEVDQGTSGPPIVNAPGRGNAAEVSEAAGEGGGGGEGRQIEPLHVAPNAPPKDKPIVLGLGGALNPSHLGHAQAVKDAVDQAQAAGYTVSKVYIAPGPDSLVQTKTKGALPLDSRGRVAEAGFPKEYKGVPIEVTTTPSQIADAAPGKVRRTDLADWMQQQHPEATAVALTGADAAPETPPQHPALYQGDPGTEHEGYHYLTVPRLEGYSSTEIRAAIKAGRPVPGMTPEAAEVYKQELAKQEQGKGAGAGPAALPRSITNTPPAPPAEPPPTLTPREQAEAQAAPLGTPAPGDVGRMDPREISVDAHRFQYKLGTDVEGVSPLLKETKVWNPDLAGVVSVWRDPADGKTYVVNGHHRVELAKRLGVSDLVVRHLEADNAEQARGIGAAQNIAEGRGTAVDAAKFFRDTGSGPEELTKRGLSLSEGKVHDGLALSRLDPSIFERVVSGDLRQGQAIKIGEATDDPAVQKNIIQMIDRSGQRLTDGQLAETIRLTMNAPQTTETTRNLFGEEHITRSLGIEKGEISDYVKQQIKRDKQIFGFVSKAGRAEQLSRAGNVIEVEKSRDIATRAAQADEVYNKLSERTGEVDDILNDAARRLSEGENGSTVKTEAYDKIRAAISKVLGEGQEGGV